MITKVQATDQNVSDFRDLVSAILEQAREFEAVEKSCGENPTNEYISEQTVECFQEVILSFMNCMIIGHDFGKDGKDQFCSHCNALNPEDES